METSRKWFHLKKFLSLGYSKNDVHSVIRSQIFEGLEKEQGYAILFSFNQSVFVSIGCELARMGLSIRHVHETLFRLSGMLDFEKDTEAISEKKFSVIVFRSDADLDYIGKHYSELKGTVETKAGRNLVTGKQILIEKEIKKERTAPLTVMVARKEKDAEDWNRALSGYIKINLTPILDSLLK